MLTSEEWPPGEEFKRKKVPLLGGNYLFWPREGLKEYFTVVDQRWVGVSQNYIQGFLMGVIRVNMTNIILEKC